jgi:hypothetical protein
MKVGSGSGWIRTVIHWPPGSVFQNSKPRDEDPKEIFTDPQQRLQALVTNLTPKGTVLELVMVKKKELLQSNNNMKKQCYGSGSGILCFFLPLDSE